MMSASSTPFFAAAANAASRRSKSAGEITIGLSASTFMPASTARVMYSALRVLLPEITTTLPARSFEHALEIVRAGVHALAPPRRMVGARVEGVDALQVLGNVIAWWRVDVHQRIDVRRT